MGIQQLLHASFCFLNTNISEHKHCDNAATNLNSENARSRMVASVRGSVGMGTQEDESSTGRVSAAGFHHVNRTTVVLWLNKTLSLIKIRCR